MRLVTTRLYLVRHGQTESNAARRFQGHADVPLDAVGRAEADAVADRLRAIPFAAVWSSDLTRARQTAAAIAGDRALTVRHDHRFREICLGVLEGRAHAELAADFPDLHRAWRDDPGTCRFPDGETLQEVQDRMWEAIEELVHATPDGTALVVGHGFAILAVLCRVLGLPLASFRRLWIDGTGITELRFQGGAASVVRINDLGHLEGREA